MILRFVNFVNFNDFEFEISNDDEHNIIVIPFSSREFNFSFY